MAGHPRVQLRYFDIRARAQFFRYLLNHRRVPFTDEHVPLSVDLSSWQETRGDRSISGDFQKMPTLEWDGVLIGEVLVIADFLHGKLGDAGTLDERWNLRHAMLRSSAYLDLLTPCIQLIWCDVFHPGVEIEKAVRVAERRLGMHLETVNRTLTEWEWMARLRDRPLAVADALLFEALDVIRATFSGHLELDALETIAAFYEQCPGRDAFVGSPRPTRITARPGETEALDRIAACFAP